MQYGDARKVDRHLETAEEKNRILLFVQYRDRVSSMLLLCFACLPSYCRILLLCLPCVCWLLLCLMFCV